MAHGDAREGKWRGKMRMEWVASRLASTLHTPRLPVVHWTDPPADWNGLVRFAERPILVSARVPSRFALALHGDAREGKWRGNWRMEWVASTLHTTSEHGVSSITTPDAHTSVASSRLNWRPPADFNGLVRFAERRNLVSARVPSHFKRSLKHKEVSK